LKHLTEVLLELTYSKLKESLTNLGFKAGQEESAKVDWKSISKEKVAALSQMFCEVGAKAGRHAGHSVGKLAIAKVQVRINKQNGLERIKCKKSSKMLNPDFTLHLKISILLVLCKILPKMIT
jgi:hypothetical protein